MTQQKQEDAFADDLAKLINRYMSEFDLTHACVIGVLECVKLDVWDDGNNEYVVELE